MKKLVTLLVLLFLTACGEQPVEPIGEIYMRCTPPTGVLANSGETVISVRGYNDEISLWTVRMTLPRDEFDQEFLQDIDLSDDEVHELFATYNQSEIEGITFQLAELNNDYVVLAMIYDYSTIASDHLNQIWGVGSFEDVVTFSSVIAGLEELGAVCAIMEIDEVDEDEPDEPEEDLPTIGIINIDNVSFMRHPGSMDPHDVVLRFQEDYEVTILDLYYNDEWARVTFETDAITGFSYTFVGFVRRQFINAE